MHFSDLYPLTVLRFNSTFSNTEYFIYLSLSIYLIYLVVYLILRKHPKFQRGKSGEDSTTPPLSYIMAQNEQWGILVRNYNLHKWATADVVRDSSRMVHSKYSGKLSRRYVFWPMWSENSPSDVALNLVTEFWRWLPERDRTRSRNGLLRPRAKSVSRYMFNVPWALDISSVLFGVWLASCRKTATQSEQQ